MTESIPSNCPKCRGKHLVKSGIIREKQRYHCKDCGYHFSVDKLGKEIEPYYVTKALQLYLEGMSYREIERILGISHVSVSKFVRMHLKSRPEIRREDLQYKIYAQSELAAWFSHPENLQQQGIIVSELGDKFMLIHWKKRFG